MSLRPSVLQSPSVFQSLPSSTPRAAPHSSIKRKATDLGEVGGNISPPTPKRVRIKESVSRSFRPGFIWDPYLTTSLSKYKGKSLQRHARSLQTHLQKKHVPIHKPTLLLTACSTPIICRSWRINNTFPMYPGADGYLQGYEL